MCLQSVIAESKRTVVVPDRSLGGFWHYECHRNTSRKLHTNFQISTLPWSAPSPMCFQIIIMEYKRMLVVPERSLGDFWHNGSPKDTSRKLHINLQISTLLESGPTPTCLQSIIVESKRMLMVPERSLGDLWHYGCDEDTSRKLHINSQISTILGSAPSTMCLQRIIMESKRTLVVPEKSLVVLT